MIQLGRVQVTSGFLLLMAWLNYLDRSFVIPLAVLACGAHELGHLLVIHSLGGIVKQIRLTAIGAELVLAEPLGYWQEGLTALAGPGVNLLLALAFCGFEGGVTFAGINLVLALFNLLPVRQMDGGRALYCTLALLAGPGPAAWAGDRLDLLCAAAALAGGLLTACFGGNITLLLVSFWLLAGCLRENMK